MFRRMKKATKRVHMVKINLSFSFSMKLLKDIVSIMVDCFKKFSCALSTLNNYVQMGVKTTQKANIKKIMH